MIMLYSALILYALFGYVAGDIHSSIFIRGGLVPEASKIDGDYYEQFELDYGCNDKVRSAGSLRGLLPGGKIGSLKESDRFLKWWNEYLEKGPAKDNAGAGRIKPFHAADFGSKSDLNRWENPKVFIVQRKMKYDKNGFLLPMTDDIDVEVREIWQPWLKARCNFAVRYIVPDRINIIKIMEKQGRIHADVMLEKDSKSKNKQNVWARMTFRPFIRDRLRGKRDIVLKRQLNSDEIFKDQVKLKINNVRQCELSENPFIRKFQVLSMELKLKLK